jgi:hypothetical protein
MNQRRTAMLAIGVVAIAVLALATSAAYATIVKYPTHFVEFKLERSGDQKKFSGQITSSKSKCVNNRKVKVIRKHNGNQETVGKDKTNGGGNFKILLPSGPVKSGTYYAKVKKKDFDTGHKVCLDAQSGTIKVS